ncbi:hypothetical protein ACWELB_19585 [Streptomyces asiaticus]|uniref:hypothetical protein n=1 Tax=Streptomyces asiaticus TaxID=114695 RepID=UPI003D737F50
MDAELVQAAGSEAARTIIRPVVATHSPHRANTMGCSRSNRIASRREPFVDELLTGVDLGKAKKVAAPNGRPQQRPQ